MWIARSSCIYRHVTRPYRYGLNLQKAHAAASTRETLQGKADSVLVEGLAWNNTGMSVCSASLYYMSITTIASSVSSTATAKGLSNSGTLSLAEFNSSEITCLTHTVYYAVRTRLDDWGSSALIGLTSDSKCGQYALKKFNCPKRD